MTVEGAVTNGGVPQRESRVFLLDAEDRPLAGTRADEQGRFRLEAPGTGAAIVASCGTGAVGVAVLELEREPQGPVSVDLADSATLHRLTVRLEGDVPEQFRLDFAAGRIDGLPTPRLAAVYGPIGEMTAGTLATWVMEEPRGEMPVQGGDWRIYAGWEDVYGARAVGDVDRVWSVVHATLDGRGVDVAGRALDVTLDGPAELVLEIAMTVRGVASA